MRAPPSPVLPIPAVSKSSVMPSYTVVRTSPNHGGATFGPCEFQFSAAAVEIQKLASAATGSAIL